MICWFIHASLQLYVIIPDAEVEESGIERDVSLILTALGSLYRYAFMVCFCLNISAKM